MMSLKVSIGFPVWSISLSFPKSTAEFVDDVSKIRLLIRLEIQSDLISRSLNLDGVSAFDEIIPSAKDNVQFKSHFLLKCLNFFIFKCSSLIHTIRNTYRDHQIQYRLGIHCVETLTLVPEIATFPLITILVTNCNFC